MAREVPLSRKNRENIVTSIYTKGGMFRRVLVGVILAGVGAAAVFDGFDIDLFSFTDSK